MSDKLFCGYCLGSEQSHALWEPCPNDMPNPALIDRPFVRPRIRAAVCDWKGLAVVALLVCILVML